MLQVQDYMEEIRNLADTPYDRMLKSSHSPQANMVFIREENENPGYWKWDMEKVFKDISAKKLSKYTDDPLSFMLIYEEAFHHICVHHIGVAARYLEKRNISDAHDPLSRAIELIKGAPDDDTDKVIREKLNT